MKIIHLLSGGLDSTVLLHELAKTHPVHAVIFDYGQRHSKEIRCAIQHSDSLGVPWTKVELYKAASRLFGKSALTDGSGGYVVPNRNAVFCHIAASIAMTEESNTVTIGCNAGDQNEFPDCRLKWIDAMNDTLSAAETGVLISAPYIRLNKLAIIRKAKEFNIDLKSVWWCYEGGHSPCGKCPACKKVEEANA